MPLFKSHCIAACSSAKNRITHYSQQTLIRNNDYSYKIHNGASSVNMELPSNSSTVSAIN